MAAATAMPSSLVGEHDRLGAQAMVCDGVSIGWFLTKKFLPLEIDPSRAAPVTTAQVCCLLSGPALPIHADDDREIVVAGVECRLAVDHR